MRSPSAITELAAAGAGESGLFDMLSNAMDEAPYAAAKTPPHAPTGQPGATERE